MCAVSCASVPQAGGRTWPNATHVPQVNLRRHGSSGSTVTTFRERPRHLSEPKPLRLRLARKKPTRGGTNLEHSGRRASVFTTETRDVPEGKHAAHRVRSADSEHRADSADPGPSLRAAPFLAALSGDTSPILTPRQRHQLLAIATRMKVSPRSVLYREQTPASW